jgi:hypothetical protein
MFLNLNIFEFKIFSKFELFSNLNKNKNKHKRNNTKKKQKIKKKNKKRKQKTEIWVDQTGPYRALAVCGVG